MRSMIKYAPLRRYLARQSAPTLSLSFAEIESLIGRLLPKGASRPDWWSDNAEDEPRHPQKAAWREAGFIAALVPGKDRVHFERRTL